MGQEDAVVTHTSAQSSPAQAHPNSTTWLVCRLCFFLGFTFFTWLPRHILPKSSQALAPSDPTKRAARMAAPALALLDDNLEEVLFRLQPDDPAGLVRAALVCKRWRRVIADPGFRRRFRKFHRTPPLLGFLGSFTDDTGFAARLVPTTSFRPPRTEHRGMRVVDSRHGRALLIVGGPFAFFDGNFELVVWDPVTDAQRALPRLPQHLRSHGSGWSAAVLCAAHGACDHLDCHRGPFRVVLVLVRVPSENHWQMFIRVYSSEDAAWSEPASIRFQGPQLFDFDIGPSLLVGNSLHFKVRGRPTIVMYNVVTRKPAVIPLPPQARSYVDRDLLMATEDGRLGLSGLNGSTLSLWSREIAQDGNARWAKCRDIQLNTLLPDDGTFIFDRAVAFANGVDTLLIGTAAAAYICDLKSGQVKKMVEGRAAYDIFPFTSFYTPALGAVSAGEEVPEAGASSA